LRLPQRADLLSLSDGLGLRHRHIEALADDAGRLARFTPRATASVMMLVRSPRAVSLMTFQSLNVVSLAAAIWLR
jgi:hypothetical protein